MNENRPDPLSDLIDRHPIGRPSSIPKLDAHGCCAACGMPQPDMKRLEQGEAEARAGLGKPIDQVEQELRERHAKEVEAAVDELEEASYVSRRTEEDGDRDTRRGRRYRHDLDAARAKLLALVGVRTAT